MNLKEIGVYILLLAYCWDWEGLPDDLKILSKVCKVSPHNIPKNTPVFVRNLSENTPEFSPNIPKILKKPLLNFKIIAKKLWNQKLYEQKKQLDEQRKDRSKAGKKSGEIRRSRAEERRIANRKAMDEVEE